MTSCLPTRGSHSTHGMSHTAIYHVWHTMKARCHSPKAAAYKHYGARGIKVCERWLIFENFLADMGDRPEDHSLDRINTDGDYSPDNCRWLPKAENLARSNIENPRKRKIQRPKVAEPLILPVRVKLPNDDDHLTIGDRFKARPKTGKPQRVMVSVPGPLVEAVKEIVRVYREQERQP